MFKKIIGTFLIGGALVMGANNTETQDVENVELQKAINYAPIIKIEFQAIDRYRLANIKDSNDIIDSPQPLEVGKTYTVSFKNDYPIEIK